MRGLFGRNSDREGAGSSESSKFYLITREGEDYIGGGDSVETVAFGGVFLHVLAIKPSFIRYAGVYS